METDASFSELLFGEIILVLLVALFFSIRYNLKQKRLLNLLFDKYNAAKSSPKLENNEKKLSSSVDKKTEQKNTIAEHLNRSISDSLLRYEKNSGSHHPHLDQNHSFSARVAALRCLYLTAEKEVFNEFGTTNAGWGLFEKKLADIIRWQDKKNAHRQEIRDHRLRLMQDRINALKDNNEKNIQLQEKIKTLIKSKDELTQYQLESQNTIKNLRNMLEKLKQLPKIEQSPIGQPSSMFDFFNSDKTDKITNESLEKNSNVRNIIRELKIYDSNFSADKKEKIDNYLNMLELELIKSDQYIGNLKKELKDAKIQATNYAIMLRDARLDEKSENIDTDGINTSIFDVPSPPENKNITSEIKRLRENNRIQRELINKMELEIQLLKNSANPSDTEEIRKEKEKEILRLERLVKECQACIDTLESEVDHLYNQLQERTGAPAIEANENSGEYISEELTMITTELEKTIVHYQQLHAINHLILELMKCESLQSFAKYIIQFAKDFKAPIGFAIYSTLGKAEYFPAAIFDKSTIELVKSHTKNDSLVHLDEGTLFIFSKIHLMYLNTPRATHPILETSLQSLINAAEECIKNIESRKSNKKQNQETEGWIESTKNHLSNIDIQYISQIEENRKTFNNFISEIRRAYHLLELQGPGAIVLDSAINEYEERMQVLLSSGDVIDHEISKLIEHMNKLKIN